jgi:Fe-S-cluster containining protein
MSQAQTVHLQLTVDGVEIEAAVPLPTGPAPRRVVLPTLQGLTDTIVQIAEARAAEAGEKISCKKGCDACCRQMVPISPAEAFALGALLDAMPPTQAARALERFDTAVETLEAKGLLERLRRRHELSSEEAAQLDRDYFAAGVNCPFLQNRACSIHNDRPLACREFLVTSPARECRNPGAGGVKPVEMPAKVSVALAGTDQERWLPLVLAREFAAGRREAVVEQGGAEVLGRVLRAL